MKVAADQRPHSFRITVAESAAQLPSPAGERFHVALSRGQLQVELYQPLRHDPQKPHNRDELYFVVAGSGSFVMGDQHVAFAAGDCLFVPAGMTHRFEDFGESITAWVVFYGDIGGDSTL